MNLGTLTAILAVVDKISPAISGISGNVGKAMGAIKGAIAGAFAVTAVTQAITKFTDFAGRITDTAAKLGLSTTAVQKLELAFKDAGVGMDTIGNSIGEMGRRLLNGDEGAVNALGALGLKTRDLLAMAPDAAFTKIADAVATVENPLERAHVAQEIFGKGGKELLAGLTGKIGETTAKFEEMGQIIDADVIAAGDDLGDSLGQLETAGMNLLGVVLKPILPILVSLAQYLAQAAQVAATVARWFGNELVGAFNRAKETLFNFLSNLAETASKVPILGTALKGIGDATTWLKEKAVAAGQALKETYAGMRQELQTQTEPAITKVATVVGNYNAKAKEAEDAQKKLNEAFRESVTLMSTAAGNWRMWQPLVQGALDSATRDAQEFVAEQQRMLTAMDLTTRAWVPFVKGVNDAKVSAKGLGDAIKGNLLGVLESIPGTLASALQGGGGIGGALKSIASQIGSSIGGSIGFSIGGPLGKSLGSAIGSFAGPLAGKIAGLFGGGAGKQANDLRDQIVATAGGIQTLAQRAAEAGTNVDALLRARNPEQVQAAWDALNGKLNAHQAQLQLARKAMEEFGIDASKAGEKFKQAEMDETARSITEKLEAMMAVGVSTDAIIEGAGDEIGAFIQRAIEMGTTVPKEWEPIVAKMIAAGTLIDANGEKFTEMSQVPFAQTLNDKLLSVMDKLLAFFEGVEKVGGALARLPRNVDIDINGRWNETGRPEGFAGGSHGIRDFGAGTLAILHGRERVQTEAQMRAEQGGGAGAVVINVDARGAYLGDYASQMSFAERTGAAVMGRLGLRNQVGVTGSF